MTWREALADCKGTLIAEGAAAAQVVAEGYLDTGAIGLGDYIALVRWSEGRSSYATALWGVPS